MWVGSGICVFSLIAGIMLVLIDAYADKKDARKLELTAEDKFHWRDLTTFGLPFWLVALSCVFVYMAMFPFIQISTTALQDKYGFDKNTAGTLYSVPYFMSAGLSPVLGYVIDKIGKRALFITTSSILVSFACFFSAVLPNYTSPNFICLGPEILIGFGYSIYASALWSSIPYIVQPRTIGSAFGMVTSMQAIGLSIAPLVTGVLLGKYPDNYTPVYMFLGSLSTIGVFFNIWLYIDDRKYRGSVLHNVPKQVNEMMASPTGTERRTLEPEGFKEFNAVDAAGLPVSDELGLPMGVEVYEISRDSRQALRRSMAKTSSSFAK